MIDILKIYNDRRLESIKEQIPKVREKVLNSTTEDEALIYGGQLETLIDLRDKVIREINKYAD